MNYGILDWPKTELPTLLPTVDFAENGHWTRDTPRHDKRCLET